MATRSMCRLPRRNVSTKREPLPCAKSVAIGKCSCTSGAELEERGLKTEDGGGEDGRGRARDLSIGRRKMDTDRRQYRCAMKACGAGTSILVLTVLLGTKDEGRLPARSGEHRLIQRLGGLCLCVSCRDPLREEGGRARKAEPNSEQREDDDARTE